MFKQRSAYAANPGRDRGRRRWPAGPAERRYPFVTGQQCDKGLLVRLQIKLERPDDPVYASF